VESGDLVSEKTTGVFIVQPNLYIKDNEGTRNMYLLRAVTLYIQVQIICMI